MTRYGLFLLISLFACRHESSASLRADNSPALPRDFTEAKDLFDSATTIADDDDAVLGSWKDCGIYRRTWTGSTVHPIESNLVPSKTLTHVFANPADLHKGRYCIFRTQQHPNDPGLIYFNLSDSRQGQSWTAGNPDALIEFKVPGDGTIMWHEHYRESTEYTRAVYKICLTKTNIKATTCER